MKGKPDTIAPLDLTLDEVVGFWAKKKPTAHALAFDVSLATPALSWQDLEDYIQGLEEEFDRKIVSNDVIGVVCDDSADIHILLNALWRCGAAVLLINRTWGDAVVSDLLTLTQCSIVFTSRQIDLPKYPNQNVLMFPKRRMPTHKHARQKGDPNSVAIYATTSGTTDDPKCVPITHKQIRSAYHSCLAVRDFSTVKRAASMFPLNGIGVLGVCFLLPREMGASTFVLPPFTISTISASWKTLFHHKVDFVYLVPALVRLLNSLSIQVKTKRNVMAFCAAAPVSLEDLQTLERKYPITVFNAYGLTELTFAVFFGCRDDDNLASDSIGFPIGIEAKILDEDGTPSDRGELYLRGPMLTDGYFNNPSATDAVWVAGWLKTGDLAVRNPDGQHFICGRLKDAVIRGGILFYLHELEYYFRNAPGVIDVCAFKGRDLPSGDELCAVVHTESAIDRSDLLAWVKQHIGEEKVPNKLFLWQRELPRNSNGKILRKELSDMYIDGVLKDEA